ncbi:hypothetical protein [Demequina iriomotensis]|uniref:hypothetical protein n=1 Tax=Demequina iriomotensis TaxID=1536641 RepID=UPI00078164E8|nr:hypothetical protein [Demequina iriomotensis]
MTRAAAPAPRDPFVAAWIAIVVDLPLFTVIGGAAAFLGAQVWEVLTDASPATRTTLDRTESAVVTAWAFIVVLGIAVVAHTVGRWLHERTAEAPPRRAAAAFAAMGGALSLIPSAVIVARSGEPASLVFVAVALVVPCALVAGLTRMLLPRVAGSEKAVTGLAIVAVLCVLLAIAVLAITWIALPELAIAD